MIVIDQNYIKKIFHKRLPNTHKGTYGHVLIIAGSKSKIGAAIICTKACLRTGAGLVSVNIPKKERIAIFTSIPEAMVEFREEEINWNKFNVFAIGPGIGADATALHLLKTVIIHVKSSMVVDADALNILARNKDELLKIPKKCILTPHAKEFDRLFGNHKTEPERRKTAETKAIEHNCIIVLKGHQTFITDGIQSFENISGNAGLAKGGSGDALTGIITALLAQSYEPLNAAILGVYLHGLAADITLKTQSLESMLISDVIENTGKAFQQIQK